MRATPPPIPKAFTAIPAVLFLPMGGVVSHKGYGLGFVVELLGGALSGQGVAAGDRVMVSNGVLFTVYNIEHFTELAARRDRKPDQLYQVQPPGTWLQRNPRPANRNSAQPPNVSKAASPSTPPPRQTFAAKRVCWGWTGQRRFMSAAKRPSRPSLPAGLHLQARND